MAKIHEVYKHWKQAPETPEYNSGELKVEAAKHRTIQQMVEASIRAGERLQANRTAQFDYNEMSQHEAEGLDPYVPPDRDWSNEMQDLYMMAMESQERLANIREKQAVNKELESFQDIDLEAYTTAKEALEAAKSGNYVKKVVVPPPTPPEEPPA